MPNSRPLATDLLSIVQETLETQIAPKLSPVEQFQMKIVSRVLATVRREMELGPQADERELARLRLLLRRDGSREQLDALLVEAIRAGDFAVDDAALLAHLRATTEDALRINNPKWLERPA